MADEHIEALRGSVTRLRELVAALTEQQLTRAAYPTEWTLADVLSHLGSGAVITTRRLDDTVAGRTTPDDFARGVWDTWNAKLPVARRGDALVADAELLSRIDAVTPEQRHTFASAMGPMILDFQQFVGMRLNEHALHTWDIAVVDDPTATIAQPAAGLIVDNLELIARFTAKPTGDTQTITVATTDPIRRFLIELSPEAVAFSPAATSSPSTSGVEIPAEAFTRLIYGRLDPDHTPSGYYGDALDTLRRVFPGP
jgi:uncharacterized protein (TIGR03083 family)